VKFENLHLSIPQPHKIVEVPELQFKSGRGGGGGGGGGGEGGGKKWLGCGV